VERRGGHQQGKSRLRAEFSDLWAEYVLRAGDVLDYDEKMRMLSVCSER
jgi:hypothetical protein